MKATRHISYRRSVFVNKAVGLYLYQNFKQTNDKQTFIAHSIISSLRYLDYATLVRLASKTNTP